MKVEYIQELTEEQAEALQTKLKVHFVPETIYCDVTYTFTETDPKEYELDVSSVEIMYVTCDTDEVPIMVNKEQKFIIAEFLDNAMVEAACWEASERLRDDPEGEYFDY